MYTSELFCIEFLANFLLDPYVVQVVVAINDMTYHGWSGCWELNPVSPRPERGVVPIHYTPLSKYPRRESNLHLGFRKPPFYPLNYGDLSSAILPQEDYFIVTEYRLGSEESAPRFVRIRSLLVEANGNA